MAEVVCRYAVALMVGAYVVAVIAFYYDVLGLGAGPGFGRQLFLIRATGIDGELSPIVPLVLSAAGLAAWATWHLYRVRWLGPRSPFATNASAALSDRR